jgi:uncharacterized protein YoxC
VSEEILKKILDLAVETRGKLGAVDELKESVDELKKTVDGLKYDVDGLKEDVGGLKGDVGGLKGDVSEISHKLGRLERYVEKRFDDIESELGTVKDAVLDVGRKVKTHDLAIKEIQEKYH